MFSQIRHFIQDFEWSSFNHIYCELDEKYVQLSKEDLECCDGFFVVHEFRDGQESKSMTFHF